MAVVGAALLLAIASIAVSQTTANAEPTTHQVRYTLTTTGPAEFNLFYSFAAPPSKDAYEADPYAFVKSEKVVLAAGVPWVFETTLTDPQAVLLTASSAARAMSADPNPRCEIVVDGQVVLDQSGTSSVQCQLRPW